MIEFTPPGISQLSPHWMPSRGLFFIPFGGITMLREMTIGLLGLAILGTVADAALTEKFTFVGGISGGVTVSSVTAAQLDSDPALELLTCRLNTIRIIDGATGAVEFQKTMDGSNGYPGNMRVLVLDIDDDGLLEVVITMLEMAMGSGTENPYLSVVIDTDAPVSTVQPWESDLGELRTAPEPTNSALELTIDLAEAGATSIRIIDVSGRLIKEVADDLELPTGYSTFQWDGKDRHGRDVASGVYFVQVTSNAQTESRRITLIR